MRNALGAIDGAVKVRNVPLRKLGRRLLCCFLVVALFAQAPALALTALPSSSAPGAAAAVPARPGVSNAGLENSHRGISEFLVRSTLLRCAGEARNHALSRACVYGGPPWFVVHRYYDPATGRYLTPDPLGDGLNPYSYAHGNPLALADPMGLCAAASTLGYYVAGAIVAAAGAAAAPFVAAAFAAAALVAATDTLSNELFNSYYGTDISSQGSDAIREAFGCSQETADTAYELFQAFLGGGAASGLGGKVPGPGEDLYVGPYGKASNANGPRSAYTPHHAPQAAAYPLDVRDSFYRRMPTINMRKDLHESTRSFKKLAVGGETLRDKLARDVMNVKDILYGAAYDRRTVRRQLRELIRQNSALWDELTSTGALAKDIVGAGKRGVGR